jgi:uncharacterized protein YbaR (Trm112 family)
MIVAMTDLLSTLVRCPTCRTAVEATVVWAGGDACPNCSTQLRYLTSDEAAREPSTPRRRVTPARIPAARRRRIRRRS